MMSLIMTRTLKITAVLLIVIFIFGIGDNHGNPDGKDKFADGIILGACTAILMLLVW